MDGRFETYIRPGRAFAAWPTHDDLTVIIVGWPFAELAAYRRDVERTFLETIELVPTFAKRMRSASREARFVGMAVPNFFRKPHGPVWALMGDAGYERGFITAYGIQDAFWHAELCATALDKTFSGARSFDAAMAEYESTRDHQVLPFFEFTTHIAALEPPTPELARLLRAVHGNQEATRMFIAAEFEHPYGRGINFQIEVADMAVLYARVKTSPWPVFLELEDRWYRRDELELGNRQFMIQDPDGYPLRFFQDLGSRPAAMSPDAARPRSEGYRRTPG
jgi:hypothetical protein